MHPFALPLLLLALGLGSSRDSASKPAPKPKPPQPKPKPRTAAEAPLTPIDPWAGKPQPKPRTAAEAPLTPIDPWAGKPPKTEAEATQQAAVNAVVTQVVKEMTATNKASAQDGARVVIDVPRRTARDAAEYLREFLARTHAYGSKKKPVREVRDAQRDMGELAIDGIVGPKTRARARQLGVKLP